MKRNIIFLSLAIALGVTVSIIIIEKDQASGKINASITGVKNPDIMHLTPGPAMMDYSPCEVIRPKTAMLLIDHGNVIAAGNVAPVLPVAHGPPNFC